MAIIRNVLIFKMIICCRTIEVFLAEPVENFQHHDICYVKIYLKAVHKMWEQQHVGKERHKMTQSQKILDSMIYLLVSKYLHGVQDDGRQTAASDGCRRNQFNCWPWCCPANH